MRSVLESFGRLVGLAFTLLGVWLLIATLPDRVGSSDRDLAFVLSAGFLGALGGIAFLLSLDGPSKFRNRPVRFLGWLGMLYLAFLPWSFGIAMLILVALVMPVVLQPPVSAKTEPPLAGA